MRRLALLALFACGGCTAVLGLDERERAADEAGSADVEAPDTSTDDAEIADSLEDDSSLPQDSAPADTSIDTSASADTFAPKDTATPPDTFVPMDTAPPPDTFVPPPDTFVPPPDTSTAPCPFFGLSCASGQSCVVTFNGSTYSVGCALSPSPSPTGSCTGIIDLRCPTGSACKTNYAGTKCAPLCTTAATCPAPYEVCASVTWSGGTYSAGVCDTCNPVANTGCTGATRCGVGTPDTAPTCRPYSDFGGRNAGASCPSSDLCMAGTVCACATSYGIDSCPAGGTCVELCNTTADCSKTTGTVTCKVIKSGSPYKGCLP